jgi:hypothetical protein
MDPFVEITSGKGDKLCTKACKSGHMSPVWGEKFPIPFDIDLENLAAGDNQDLIFFSVYTKSLRNELIGRVALQVKDLCAVYYKRNLPAPPPGKDIGHWFELGRDSLYKTPAGYLYLSFTFEAAMVPQGGGEVDSEKVEWQEDKAATHCPFCEQAFFLLNRRHHCRKCGVCVCDKCSKGRMILEASKGPQRVCSRCDPNATVAGEGDESATPSLQNLAESNTMPALTDADARTTPVATPVSPPVIAAEAVTDEALQQRVQRVQDMEKAARDQKDRAEAEAQQVALDQSALKKATLKMKAMIADNNKQMESKMAEATRRAADAEDRATSAEESAEATSNAMLALRQKLDETEQEKRGLDKSSRVLQKELEQCKRELEQALRRAGDAVAAGGSGDASSSSSSSADVGRVRSRTTDTRPGTSPQVGGKCKRCNKNFRPENVTRTCMYHSGRYDWSGETHHSRGKWTCCRNGHKAPGCKKSQNGHQFD